MEIHPDPSDNKIKCERRYNEFHMLYERLQKIFPYIIIPELEKNFLSKIISIEENFYIKRKNQLNLFIKHINEHEELKSTKEFFKFIRDPNFDHGFFAEEVYFNDIRDYPESMRNHDSIANKIVDFFKTPFSKENIELNYNDSERNFLKKYDFYTIQLNNFLNFKKIIVHLISFCNLTNNKFFILIKNYLLKI